VTLRVFKSCSDLSNEMLAAARRSRSRSRSGRARLRALYASRGRAPSIPRARAALSRRRARVATRGSHTFSRYCTALDPIEMNNVYKAGNVTVAFTDLVQASDFTNLFDMYRISKVIVTFQLVTNPNSASPLNIAAASATTYYNNPTNWFPKLWYITDYDGGADETIPTIKERQGVRCRILKPNSTIRIAFTPKCRTLTYSTSTSTGYAPKNIKIDMSDINVEHFGLKYVMDANQQNPDDDYPFRMVIERKLVFTCYGVR